MEWNEVQLRTERTTECGLSNLDVDSSLFRSMTLLPIITVKFELHWTRSGRRSVPMT